MPTPDELIAEWRARGLIVDVKGVAGGTLPDLPAELPKAKQKPDATPFPALVAPAFIPPSTWVIPLQTANESNGRDWRARSRRSGKAWKAVREAVRLGDLALFEEALRGHRPVLAKFVRLGGRRLDPLVNLPSALKGAEDALAYLLGVDDGSRLWLPSCDQEPGGAAGVRIELKILEEETCPLPKAK